jgi:hypothetical protein
MKQYKYFALINAINNHNSLYESLNFKEKYFGINLELFKINSSNRRIVLDEPFSIKSLFLTYLISFKFDYDIIIHNCNKWLNINNSKSSIKNNLKILLRVQILKNCTNIIVVSPTLKNYLKKYGYKNILYVPFSKRKNNLVKSKSDTFYIIIPGSINNTKRYDRLELIISNTNFNTKVALVFLGISNSIYSKNILNKLKKVNHHNLSIVSFNSFVSNDSFHNWMLKANIILSDFNENVKTDDAYIEKFGSTKETGVPWLAFSYNIPLIMPSIYQNHFNELEIINIESLNSLDNIISEVL